MSELSATRFEIIRLYDPAIVHCNSAAVLAEYGAVRDRSILVVEEGKRPIVFHCRGLTRDQRTDVRDQRTDSRKHMLAFRYGLVSVEDIPRPDGTTTTFEPHRHNAKDALTPEAMDKLEESYGFNDVDFIEVGNAVWNLSFLARDVPPRCPLPDSSVHAVDTLRGRRAAQSKDLSTQTDESSASHEKSKRQRKGQSTQAG